MNAQPRSRSRWLGVLRHAIGPLVLVAILSSIDLEALRGALARARVEAVLLAAALMLPPVALRALRWRLLLGPVTAGSGVARLLAVYANAIFVGSVTPGRVGELVKVVHVTRLGATRGEALASVLIDRLFDVGLLVAVGGIGLWVLALSDTTTSLAVATGAALAAGLLVCAWHLAVAPARAALRGRWLERMPRAWRERLRGVGSELRVAVEALSPPALWGGVLLTAGAWSLTYLANYLLAQSLGLHVGYLEMCAISAICSLVALLPISVLGAGTRDAALILILARFGGSPAEAVALSTLMLGLTLWTALACGALRPFASRPPASAEPPREG